MKGCASPGSSRTTRDHREIQLELRPLEGGGQFERLIGVMKSSVFKAIGGATLTWSEFNEVLLDVETQINRHPLSYVKDDIELPILTPATFLYQWTNQLPEEETWRITDRDIQRRAKYLWTCKDKMWSPWQREYLTALRERHNLTHAVTKFQPKKGDVVIVKTNNTNRGTWPLAIVNEVYPGSDGIICAVQLRTAKSMLERPVQHLYPLELECDLSTPVADPHLNPQARDFLPRRDTASAARVRMKQVADAEQCELRTVNQTSCGCWTMWNTNSKSVHENWSISSRTLSLFCFVNFEIVNRKWRWSRTDCFVTAYVIQIVQDWNRLIET